MTETSENPVEWDAFHTSFSGNSNEVSGKICRNSRDASGEWKYMPSLPPHVSKDAPSFMDEMGSSVNSMLGETLSINGAIRFSSNSILREAFGANSNYLISLEQLIPRAGLKKALLTSFIPCSIEFFMNHFDTDVELTAVLPPHIAEEFDLDSKSKGLFCRHPFHNDRICDLCEKELTVGEVYFRCLSCGIDLCGKCRKEMNVLSFMAKELPHKPHNCYCEEIIHATSKECDCEEKWTIEIVVAPHEEDTYCIQHGKLMILDYESHLRIIISSFNLDDDKQWGVCSDSFWWQDFPKDANISSDHMTSSFFLSLHTFITALGCNEWASHLTSLSLNTSHLDPNLHLIASIPVPFRPKDSKLETCSGICAVDFILKDKTPKLDSASPAFVSVFSLGAAGLWWQESMANALGVRLGDGSLRLVLDRSTFLFNTEMDLRSEASLWHVADNEDGRNWHSKMAFRCWNPVGCRCGKLHGWVMIGSHNWSKASWGTSKKLGDPKRGENHVWELGVLWISPSCIDSVLDLKTVPVPFTPSTVRPFSRLDSYILKSFEVLPRSSVVRRLCMVCDYGRVGVTVALPHSKSPVPEATLDRDIWRRTGLSYPPNIGTILYVRLLVSKGKNGFDRRVIWVEGVFEEMTNLRKPLIHVNKK